ncbi:MAG: nickel-dependent lactate racemase [Candidatus Bathyarchaeia archaeon]
MAIGDVKKVVELPQGAWFGDDILTLPFPPDWDISVCKMAGHDAPPVTDEEIRKAFANPIGTKTISELAKGKKEVVIVVDDITRATPTAPIIPYVLEEIHKAGITKEHTRFIMATGAHKTPTREDWVKKVGEEIVAEYMMYNHNVYDHFVDLGTTSRGTPVKINREFMECDLKIAVGGCKFHAFAGFGGGGKIILPGVAAMETIIYNHEVVSKRYRDPTVGMGKVVENVVRLDMEEAARMAGLDVKVDIVFNNRREPVRVFVGDVVAEYREAHKFARGFYKTEPYTDADIVVVNTYPMEDEQTVGIWAANASVRRGGDVVMIVQSVEGQIHHYVYGQFGTRYGGRGWTPPSRRDPVPKAEKVYVFTEYPWKRDQVDLGRAKKISYHTKWDEIIDKLQEKHGDEAKVAIYPYAAIQIPPLPEEW